MKIHVAKVSKRNKPARDALPDHCKHRMSITLTTKFALKELYTDTNFSFMISKTTNDSKNQKKLENFTYDCRILILFYQSLRCYMYIFSKYFCCSVAFYTSSLQDRRTSIWFFQLTGECYLPLIPQNIEAYPQPWWSMVNNVFQSLWSRIANIQSKLKSLFHTRNYLCKQI